MSSNKAWIIGGPGTLLPPPLESFLSWSLCISCLSVSCYHYVRTNVVLPFYQRWKIHLRSLLLLKAKEEKEEFVYMPLTTHSRTELQRCTVEERLEQLILALCHYASSQNNDTQKVDTVNSKEETISRAIQTIESTTDATLVHLLRANDMCRRLASLALRSSSSSSSSSCAKQGIKQRLKKLYPQLLTLPPSPSSADTTNNNLTISLILPLYKESVEHVKSTLQHAYQHCTYPKRVEVILVDANHSPHKDNNTDSVYHSLVQDFTATSSTNNQTTCVWKDIKVCIYTKGGGRGPSLNYGATQSGGDIYTFCHSDTLLPHSWDVAIQTTLSSSPDINSPTNNNCHEKEAMVVQQQQQQHRVNACAFHFGIGRISNTVIPGLSAVETTANLRSKWFVLPYGDQTLSLYSNVFTFLGGYPDQCLMEDYELVSLLRTRSSFLSSFSSKCHGNEKRDKMYKEELVLVPSADGRTNNNNNNSSSKSYKALCSPRRWSKFGVLYVTYMNSYFVNLYAKGLHSDDLYCLYYKCKEKPYRFDGDLSPWEVIMKDEIVNL